MNRYEVKIAETCAPYRYWTILVVAASVAGAIETAFVEGSGAALYDPPFLIDARRIG